MKPFDPTKPVQTRDGRKAQIVATDLSGDLPIAAIVSMPNGGREMVTFHADGIWWSYESSHDLVNIPCKEKRTTWVNIDPGHDASGYESEHLANRFANSDRIACVPIEYEVELP